MTPPQAEMPPAQTNPEPEGAPASAREPDPGKPEVPTLPARGRALGMLTSPMPTGEVVKRLTMLSKRGKLPGFEADAPRGAAFSANLFGAPFDQTLVAIPETPGEGPARLRLERRWQWRLPLIFAVVLIVSIEPGATLLQSLLPNSWGWIQSHLRWWYYPLAIAQIPFVVRMIPKSRSAAITHARETLEKIAREINGRVEPPAEGETPPPA